MRTLVVLLLGALLSAVAFPAPAAADLCPPLPVTFSSYCYCTVQNWSYRREAAISGKKEVELFHRKCAHSFFIFSCHIRECQVSVDG